MTPAFDDEERSSARGSDPVSLAGVGGITGLGSVRREHSGSNRWWNPSSVSEYSRAGQNERRPPKRGPREYSYTLLGLELSK